MLFGGIQKLTLLDFPDKTACTVFTTGCNFRCPFCHNAGLVFTSDAKPLEKQNILDFLQIRRGLLDGVCISGGEPLLHNDLGEFIREVKSLGFLIKLDTNGSFPDKLARLMEDGNIDYVAMDIKNIPEKYAATIGLPEYDPAPVMESAALLLSDATPYEFRTTVVRELHAAGDLVSLAQWISGAERYYLQCFTNSGNILQSGFSAYSEAELQKLINKVRTVIPHAELRGI